MCNKRHYNMVRTGRKYEPEEVLSHVERHSGKKKVDFDGHSIKMWSQRYWTFKLKGLTCVSCGLEGKYFRKERSRCTPEGTYHFNLFAVDEEGDEVLMTKDHIIPRSKGGKDRLNNYQTLCKPCNEAKRDQV